MSRLASAAAAVLSTTGLGLAAFTAAGPQAVQQPIPFNHARHAEFDIECSDCHLGVEETPFATLPRTSLCMSCHEEDTTTTPDKDRLRDFASAEREIPWERLYRLPAHVVFSHERHVALGGFACDVCHGDHGATEHPPEQPVAETVTMDGCMECHETHGASVDCIACHR